jgi:DNA-3-methyladenine glycosylase I
MTTMDDRIRCAWATHTDQEAHYHDTEWGRPQRDETTLFEFLVLEGAQAGLSWRTILNKRDGYRAVFDDYDIARIAQYSDADLEARVQDARIVRNRLKVWGVRKNAQAYLRLRDEVGGLAPYLWNRVDNTPVVGGWTDMQQVPATTPLSDAISKDMKKRGFTFVGSTIIYAYLQATGVVNDHLAHCWCAAR